MLGIFNTITIDSKTIYRGNEFTLSRDYLYAGEIETCTGKRCADLVGWRYADLTVNWDAIPQEQMLDILGLTGEEVEMIFAGPDGESVTETVIPKAITSTATRYTRTDGTVLWKNVGLQLQFTQAHGGYNEE